MDCLGNLGAVYQARQNWHRAKRRFQQALKLISKIDYPAGKIGLKINLGYTFMLTGKHEQALAMQDTAVSAARTHGNPDLLLRALAGRGDTWQHHGRLTEAQNDYAEAIDLVESISGDLKEESDHISYFGAGKPTLYRRLVHLLALKQYYPAEALYYVECGRSRAFIELLTQSLPRIDIQEYEDKMPLTYAKITHLLGEEDGG